ncbi:CAP domain-containing protein [Erythrobacter alti]|uniref:CAP domain-containing protein n=1 Tax=Erythrobacter alti TaxID=1896145 RepID=UPI0030F4398C
MPPTAEEQLTLELINRLRMDPDGEYARLTDPDVLAEIQYVLNYFGVDLSSFQAAMAAIDPAAPLAWNDALALAASRHNAEMIDADTQSHQLPGEMGLGDRITDAGYTGWSNLAENIYAFSDSVIYGHAGFVIDWGFDDEDFDSNGVRYSDWQTRGDGIQDPAGHLLNIVNPVFTEIGIAVTEETDATTSVGPYVITHNFGNRWSYDAQFVGVVINDTDNDDFYDIGEGMGNVTVTLTGTAGTFTTTTWASGGWQIAAPAGTYDIVFTGGGLSGQIAVTATLGAANVKVDVEAADAVVVGSTQNGTSGTDTLNGDGGVDILNGLGGDDFLYGFGNDDTLDGGTGDDEMYGGAGDDTYYIDNGMDQVFENAGEGNDRVYSSFNLRAFAGKFADIENFGLVGTATDLRGNAHANTLLANATRSSKLYGLNGDDTLTGADFNDVLDGGSGADVMAGGQGNDIYIVDDAGDVVTELFGDGTDLVRARIDYVLPDNVEDMKLQGAATTGTGNAQANYIRSKNLGATIYGMAGNDRLVGGTGRDILYGGDDDDALQGKAGSDDLFGGDGNDVLYGGGGADFLYGDGGIDRLHGGSGSDVLFGGDGDDTLYGDGNNDTLDGGAGVDRLFGGLHDDILIGGADRDVFYGEAGADTFVFDEEHFAGLTANTADQIKDFLDFQGDKIDLSLVDAIFGGADDAFTFIADAAFSGTAGELRWEHIGSNTMLYMDTDGDAQADYAIRLDGTLNLAEADFIL